MIPNFCSYKADVEFSIVCFNVVRVRAVSSGRLILVVTTVTRFESKPNITDVLMILPEKKKIQKMIEEDYYDTDRWKAHCQG